MSRRSAAADQRDDEANVRDDVANQRDKTADERDCVANERETLANERDAAQVGLTEDLDSGALVDRVTSRLDRMDAADERQTRRDQRS